MTSSDLFDGIALTGGSDSSDKVTEVLQNIFAEVDNSKLNLDAISLQIAELNSSSRFSLVQELVAGATWLRKQSQSKLAEDLFKQTKDSSEVELAALQDEKANSKLLLKMVHSALDFRDYAWIVSLYEAKVAKDASKNSLLFVNDGSGSLGKNTDFIAAVLAAYGALGKEAEAKRIAAQYLVVLQDPKEISVVAETLANVLISKNKLNEALEYLAICDQDESTESAKSRANYWFAIKDIVNGKDAQAEQRLDLLAGLNASADTNEQRDLLARSVMLKQVLSPTTATDVGDLANNELASRIGSDMEIVASAEKKAGEVAAS